MDNDNGYDDSSDAPGRSVFGDDPPISSGSSVFGDPGDDVIEDPELPLGLEDAAAGGGASVFGGSDDSDAPGLDDDPWAGTSSAAKPDSSATTPDVAAPIVSTPDEGSSELTIDSWSTPTDDLDDAASAEVSSESVFGTAAPTPDSVETPDVSVGRPGGPQEFTSSDENVALDVEPGEEDDLDAWSDLNAPADLDNPSWGADPEPSGPAAWQPESAASDEPELVQIGGADQGERFFGFDDDGRSGEFVDDGFVDEGAGGRNLQAAVLTGVGLLVVAFIALQIGPLLALALVVVAVALSAGELFNALRVGGYQPATLLGLAASIALPIAVFFRGTQAVALVLALSVIFALLWFLAGVGQDIPVMNMGVTLLGITYVGVLGSFGTALLEVADRFDLTGNGADDGTGLLFAAIIITVGYDVGAFFAGRAFGRTPLAAVSPNKTVEGLIGGAIASLVAVFVLFGIIRFGEPFNTFGSATDALILGVIGAIVAPLGDLGESLIKRDLGIKDMGTALPGHGGFLDRFDALLFVLPAVYFFAESVFYTT